VFFIEMKTFSKNYLLLLKESNLVETNQHKEHDHHVLEDHTEELSMNEYPIVSPNYHRNQIQINVHLFETTSHLEPIDYAMNMLNDEHILLQQQQQNKTITFY